MRHIRMMGRKSLTRRTAVVPALFVGLLAAAALAPSAASGGGISQEKLEKAGWFCTDTPFADEQHCAKRRTFDRFVSGEAKTATFLVFDAEGEDFLGTEFNIRDDLFVEGRPCPTDPPTYKYTDLQPLLLLPYWACHRFDSDHT